MLGCGAEDREGGEGYVPRTRITSKVGKSLIPGYQRSIFLSLGEAGECTAKLNGPQHHGGGNPLAAGGCDGERKGRGEGGGGRQHLASGGYDRFNVLLLDIIVALTVFLRLRLLQRIAMTRRPIGNAQGVCTDNALEARFTLASSRGQRQTGKVNTAMSEERPIENSMCTCASAICTHAHATTYARIKVNHDGSAFKHIHSQTEC